MGYGLYASLTDEQLEAEILEYRGVIAKTAKNGIGVIAGEGRRIEYTTGNLQAARTELRNLLTEARRRGLAIGDGSGSGIAVEIG